MEILDKEIQQPKSTTWNYIIITNIILGIIFLFLFTMENLDRNHQIDLIEISAITFGVLFFINLFICPISLFFSKKYWLKWLIISAFSFVLCLTLGISNAYINLINTKERIENRG